MKENDIIICKKCLAFEKCKGYFFGVKCENNALFIPHNKFPKRNKKIQSRINKIKVNDAKKLLENYKITEKTKYHSYDYMYNTFIEILTDKIYYGDTD